MPRIFQHLAACVFLLNALLIASNAQASGNAFIANQLDSLNEQIGIYEKIVAQGGWPVLSKASKLELGATSERIPTIREILKITGDYQASNTPQSNSNFYDSELVTAIEKFQTRHGLKADGVIGAATQAALAVPAGDRLNQLKINAERLRNFNTADISPTSIFVNLPAYTLFAVEDQKLAIEMPVIIGTTKNQTPQMDNEITYLQFRPNWYVPKRIAAAEILPKIINDPSYLNRNGFIISQNGQSVDPHGIDWASYSKGNFPFSIVQKSGDGNALGKVKFHMPDSDAIYLHDTSRPELFANADRALSHGCVRLGNPLALAQFVLKHGNNITPEDAEIIYNKGKTERVSLQTPIPVHIGYWTAWVDLDTKQPNFYRDVYSKDGALIAKKEAAFQID